MKALWTGAIRFGLINIPIKLLSATSSKRLNFDYIHKADQCRVGYEYVCKNSGESVDFKDIARGYEVEPGKYVLLKDQDFKRANLEKTNSIRVLHFVKTGEIPPEYFDKPYYITPDKNTDEGYVLLRQALLDTGTAAMVQYVLRNREYLGLIRVVDHRILVLNQMRYGEQLRDFDELEVPDVDAEVDPKQLSVAKKLVDKLTTDFRPERYEDTYTEELMRLIETKAKGKRPKTKGEKPTPTEIQELLVKLQESLDQLQRSHGQAR